MAYSNTHFSGPSSEDLVTWFGYTFYDFFLKGISICDAWRDLAPFLQFKKRENTSMGVFHVF